MTAAPAPTLWLDVGDLIHYLVHHSRPSGIQRVTFEICRALHQGDGAGHRVRLVRRVGGPRDLVTARWEDLETAFRLLADQASEAEAALAAAWDDDDEDGDGENGEDENGEDENGEDIAPGDAAAEPATEAEAALPDPRDHPPEAAAASPMVIVEAPLPVGTRDILAATAAAEARVVRALARLPFVIGANIGAGLRRRRQRAAAARQAAEAASRAAQAEAASRAAHAEAASRVAASRPQPPPRATISMAQFSTEDCITLADAAAPGDVLLVLGSPWSHRDYGQTVRWVRDDLRMRFAPLIYDLIPLRRPEWCDRHLVAVFSEWHRSVLPMADQIFAISRATADDVTAWTREIGITLHNPVRPIPMGTGLMNDWDADDRPARAGRHLPKPGSYVLFVSTLEARKNHALLFRVWRRLLSEMPRDRVPTLVFAGRVGWLVSDLVQQMENAHWLGGKLRLVRDPTDADLHALYQGCLFTLFPSLHEGWGLPVSESLALGRPCLVSNRTSLPEAGGTLARYFDPEDLDDTCRAVREVLDDAAVLTAWRDRVAREFEHVSWESSAAVIRQTLEKLEEEVLF